MTAKLDETLSAPARLRICGYLSGCTEADFKAVQQYCELSQSSLSKHLTTLSDKGYVDIRKVSAARYTKTRIGLTTEGRQALGEHVEYLQSIAKSIAQH